MSTRIISQGVYSGHYKQIHGCGHPGFYDAKEIQNGEDNQGQTQGSAAENQENQVAVDSKFRQKA
jgi:hypothetical protein